MWKGRTPEEKQYQAEWQRKHRAEQRKLDRCFEGRCPFCGMFLSSDYHRQFPCHGTIMTIEMHHEMLCVTCQENHQGYSTTFCGCPCHDLR